jgi:hypothetical protein
MNQPTEKRPRPPIRLAPITPRNGEEQGLIAEFKAHLSRLGHSWKGWAMAKIRKELTPPT